MPMSGCTEALLQNRFVSALSSQASTQLTALPPQVRSSFVSAMEGAAKNGRSTLTVGVLPQIATEIAQISHEVFTFAFVTAMRQMVVLPIAILAVGAASCLMIKNHRVGQSDKPTPPQLVDRMRQA